jgi:lipoate-protein ligase B
MRVAQLGTLVSCALLDYSAAWELQRRLLGARAADHLLDTLILLEHPPVFTIGRTGRDAHWGGDERLLHDAGYRVYRIERGGSITFHGPGQLVGYPILKLRDFCSGPKAYMRRLEEVVIRTLAAWDLPGRRIERLPGVWVDEAKIAAMGVRITRGVTMHGFALNVSVDLAPFARIVPCGIEGCRVTSMEALLGRAVDRAAVRERLAREFAAVFDLEWTGLPTPDTGLSAPGDPTPAGAAVARSEA